MEVPAKDATMLLNTNESLEVGMLDALSVMGLAILTFSMVVYPPVIEAEKSLIIYLYGKFHAKLEL